MWIDSDPELTPSGPDISDCKQQARFATEAKT